ncbi:hypothetical protein Taro_047831 [Colocasia esculenta]|uniref:FLZ-type domain-containing protein n=1 Tax=Colocasia esculenta TaxID=4460 RepID=A0A843X5V1_COLES|nr:hypothetical protein [Colocasia esculenta]
MFALGHRRHSTPPRPPGGLCAQRKRGRKWREDEGRTQEPVAPRSSKAMEIPNTASSSSPVMRRQLSCRALRPLSPRSAAIAFSFELPCEEAPRHFLDACALCRRPLGRARDIFMYRGDTPFCSEECRQEQIELDAAREEEEAGYRRRRRRGGGRHVGDPTAVAADVQSVPAGAAEPAAVAV